MSNKIQIGVSKWIFEFDNDQKVELNYLSREVVVNYTNGKTSVILTDCTFDEEFIDLFKNGTKIKKLVRCMYLYPIMTTSTIIGEAEELYMDYSHLEITKIINTSNMKETGIFTIHLESK